MWYEYDIHNSNLTGLCDEEDTAVHLRTEKILVYSALAIIIILSYAYAASASNQMHQGDLTIVFMEGLPRDRLFMRSLVWP